MSLKLFKLLLICMLCIGIAYFIFRSFYKPKRLEQKRQDFPESSPEKEVDYGEYTDYEEIE